MGQSEKHVRVSGKAVSDEVVLSTKDVNVYYGDHHALHNTSLDFHKGEITALIGPSGCGKSTFARTLLGLYPKTDGDIFYKGRNIGEPEIGKDYRRQVQMIFQDPYASLDPRMTVEDIISEPLRNYALCSDDRERRQRVADLLTQVDLRRKRPSAILTNSAAASVNASESPERLPSIRNASFVMNRFQLLTCQSKSRS